MKPTLCSGVAALALLVRKGRAPPPRGLGPVAVEALRIETRERIQEQKSRILSELLVGVFPRKGGRRVVVLRTGAPPL